MVTITQADRDAAYKYCAVTGYAPEHDFLAEAFARHREAAMIEGARLALEAAADAIDWCCADPVAIIRAIDPAAICGLDKQEIFTRSEDM